jgi:hypothetical protein
MKNQKELSWDDIKKMNSETAKMLKNLIKMQKESRREMKESRREIKETRAQMKETAIGITRTEKMIANSNKRIEGISKSNGLFCEEYFINSFKENPFFLGEKYDRVLGNHKPLFPEIEDEYDVILLNGTTVVLIEMKYKADINDVGKMFSKLHTYRTNYPVFNDYKIYLGLASFSFSKVVRDRAAKEGIVLIQQRGDKIEVVSENIRAW